MVDTRASDGGTPRWMPYLAVGLIALVAALLNRGYSTEDAFITYRYSFNLASGNGFVYNLGEHYLGTSAPLYGLLLGILGIPNPNWIPTISSVLCSAGLVAAAIGIYAYGDAVSRRTQGVIASALFVLSPLTLESFGSEFPLLMAVIVWSLVFYLRGKTTGSAALAGIAILIRPDSALVLVVIGIDYLVAKKKLPFREILIVIAILAPFLILAKVYYGSFFPGTMAAKVAQTKSGNWHLFIRDAYGALRNRYFPPSPGAGYSTALKIPLAALFLGLSLLRVARPWRLALIWVALFVLFYQLARLPYYHWYLVPASLGLSLLAAGFIDTVAIGLSWMSSRISQISRHAVAQAVAAIAFLFVVSLRTLALSKSPPGFDPKMKLYEQIGAYFDANTSPQDSIGYVEIGLIGYYSHRQIIDPLGLVTKGVAEHVATRDFSWALQQYQPTYILRTSGFDEFLFKGIDNQAWFSRHYSESKIFAAPGAPTVVVYKRSQ